MKKIIALIVILCCFSMFVMADQCPDCSGKGKVWIGGDPQHKPKQVKCEKCKGTGEITKVAGRCSKCNGSGKLEIKGKLGPQKCPDCKGTGKIAADACTDCNGTGHDDKHNMDCQSCHGTGKHKTS